MKVIHVIRKPLEGTVAQNSLKWGTGGLNIDRSRIGTQDNLNGGAYALEGSPRPNPEDWRYKRGGTEDTFTQPSGRWPANLILEHHQGCRKVGTEKQKYDINTWDDKARPFGGAGGLGLNFTPHPHEFEVDIWECVESCPINALDGQSGILTSGSVKPGYMRNSSTQPSHGGFEGGFGDAPLTGFGDSGGASRFFQQVGGASSSVDTGDNGPMDNTKRIRHTYEED